MHGYQLPADFLIGTANSAFQSEGAWETDGKSESVMDHFAKLYAGKYPPGRQPGQTVGHRSDANSEEMPDRGCYFYDNYEQYIEDMQKTGQNTYRFSIAWSRVIPTGVGQVNPKGIEFYNKVIDKLLSCGITPFVDLYHWDLPQCLQEQGGFLNPQFPEWFEQYAKVCFEAFGDRVKMWSTFNELQIVMRSGYLLGRFPPYEMDRAKSNLAGHHCIIAHFRAVRQYRAMELGGQIGIVNCMSAASPAEMTQEDLEATRLQVAYAVDWWTQPLVEGVYPPALLEKFQLMRDTMPEHYQEDLDRWFAPMDFVGINYYVASRAKADPKAPLGFSGAQSFYSEPGQAFVAYPPGLMDVVQYFADRYPSLDIYISENGCCMPNIHDEEKECDDPERISYLREHLRMAARCVRAGYKLKGYFYWNDADSYEAQDGYRLRFGLTWVDHATGRRRWKKSRYYFSQICKTHMID